jgi:tetratricopeptide (TPR) repeat protein
MTPALAPSASAPGPRSRVRLALLVALCACALVLPACAGSRQRTTRIDAPAPLAQRVSEARSLAQRAQGEAEANPDEAINLYRRSLEAYEDFPAAWNNLGVLLMSQQRYLEAAEVFAIAGERAARDPRPVYNLGLTWERASYLEEALRHYGRALERDPRFVPALRAAVRAEQALGMSTEALEDRIRMALMVERDPEWRAFFERQRTRVRGDRSLRDPRATGLDADESR